VAGRNVFAAAADDDAEFAFIGNLAGVARRPQDRIVRTDDTATRLDQIKRMRGRPLAKFGG